MVASLRTLPLPLVAGFIAAVGLVIGSYLNVVIYRLPRGLSTVRPRSRCPGCGGQIRALDNIPLVSWLLLRGRCRSCRARIPWRYPAIEGATGLLFLACGLRFGVTVDALVAAVLVSLLLALALIDLEHFLLPDRLTYPGIVLGLALAPFSSLTTVRSAVAGAALGAFVLLLVILLWRLLRNEQGMGYGDVKMLALVGAFLGIEGVAVTFFLATLLGAAAGLALMLRSGRSLRDPLPFGVFLSAGALLALFFGRPLAHAYTGLLYGGLR